MIITIDGPVGTGKSTIAKQLANRIRFIFFDTGAMYRTLTYSYLKKGFDLNDKSRLNTFLDTFLFDIKMRDGEKQYFLADEDVTQKIRTQEVTNWVSKIAAIEEVRKKLVTIQRQFSEGVNAVFEGRDMGTVVFPEADLKIYLTGKAEVRAKRRFDEMMEKFPEESKNLTFEKVLRDVNERDKQDSERTLSPLKKADDAFIIDTSELSIAEVIDTILEYREKMVS